MGYQNRRAEYAAKLKDPRWQKRRLEILERDGWKCLDCEDTETTLHVHHYWYEPGKEPWEHSDESMGTLCENCHEVETQCGRNEEQLLIRTLREQRFSCGDLVELARVFSTAKRFEDGFDSWHDLIISLEGLVSTSTGHRQLQIIHSAWVESKRG